MQKEAEERLVEWVEYSKIKTIAVAINNAGNRVSSVGIVDSLSDNNHAVFQFKRSYEDQEHSKYISVRVKLHAPYTILRFSLFFFSSPCASSL